MTPKLTICIILATALSVSAQPFVVEGWDRISSDEAQADSTGALVLGPIDSAVNLALGKPAADHAGFPAKVTDNNTGTNNVWNSGDRRGDPVVFNFYVQVDLEEDRLIDHVIIKPLTGDTREFMKGYSIQTSLDDVVFTEQVLNTRNLNPLIDTTFAPVAARHVRVQIKAIDRLNQVKIGEVEVYGSGFLNVGSFTSDVVNLSTARNFGMARWTAEVGMGSELTLQFRSGPSITPDDNWSDWSSPSSEQEGVLIDLPEPRRFLQYQVNLATDNPATSPRLTSLEIDHADPLAAAASGQVSRDDTDLEVPVDDAGEELAGDEVPVGRRQNLLFEVDARVGSGSGFHIFRLEGPNSLDVQEVLLDDATLAEGSDYTLINAARHTDIIFADPIVANADIQISFSTILYDEVNLFHGQLVDQLQPDNPQQIEATSSQARENTLALFGEGLIDRVFDKGTLTVAPNPFSPNDDDRFDVVRIQYDLAHISVLRPVAIRIFDLNGRPVRAMEMEQKSGTHAVEWDGVDDDGDLVPPGLYLFEISVDSGDGIEFNGAIGVAY